MRACAGCSMSSPSHKLVLIAFALAQACGDGAVAARKPTAVRTMTIAETELARQSRYTANILPVVRVDMAFKIGGYIEWIEQVKGSDGKLRSIGEGDLVEKGQLLARVRAGEVTEKLGEVQAMGSGAAAQAEAANEQFERARTLFEKGSIPKSQFDAARAAYKATRAQVAAANAGAKQVRSVVSETTLRSPINGIILKRTIEVGSLVGPGVPGFIVADVSIVKASFGVPDTLLGSLKLGSPISVSAEALPGETFSGVVSRIAPAADLATRVFEVETTIPNTEGSLKTGMVATVHLGEEGEAKKELLVPLSAIVRSPGKKAGFAIFIVNQQDGKHYAFLREVVLGEINSNYVPAISGLHSGESVVVMGAGLLSDGEEVRIIPSESAGYATPK